MYIKYDNKDYSCKCSINNNSITYRGLSEDFPLEVDGEITLYADNGFELRKDNTNDYLRQTFLEGTLTLTNLPEPEPETEFESEPKPTAEGVTWEAMADAIMEGVNEV